MRLPHRLAPLALTIALACSHGQGPDERPPAPVADASPAPDARAPSPPAPDARAAEPFSLWRQREPIYELYVRHFSAAGNFRGVEERLPELKALGVGIVWLLPVHEIGSLTPSHGGVATDAPWGNPYAVKSYERLNPEYGSDGTEAGAAADLRRLVRRAHDLGMHVIVDWVPNHTAWDNPLLDEHPDWYAKGPGGEIRAVGEFPWIAQLDWSKPGLREYMTRTMAAWVRRFDLDGFRVDYAHGMPLDYFASLRAELERVKPVFLLAEAGDPAFHPSFDMTYDWDVYPRFGEVARGARPVSFLDDALLARQLVPYAQRPDALVMRMTYNHDDNGKFTLMDRYQGGDRAFFVLACTLPGKPLVFDGQEVGMNVFDGSAVRRSINLGHDPRVKIDWTDPDGHRPFTTKLLQLFRANSALHHPGGGDFRKIDTAPADFPYAFVRRDGKNTVLVVLNLSGRAAEVTLRFTPNAGPLDGSYVNLFNDETEEAFFGMTLAMKPWEYRVLVQGPTRP